MSGLIKKATVVAVCAGLLLFAQGMGALGCGGGVDCHPSSQPAESATGPAAHNCASLPCQASNILDCCRMTADVGGYKFFISSTTFTTSHIHYAAHLPSITPTVDANRSHVGVGPRFFRSRAHPIPPYLLNAVWRC